MRWTHHVVLHAASQKLTISNWRNVPLAISLDIAAMGAWKSTNRHTKMHARNERVNYVTSSYSSNRKAPILGTARSAWYLCRLIFRNMARRRVAAKRFVTVAIMPIRCEKRRKNFSTLAHFVANLCRSQKDKVINNFWKELRRMIQLGCT